MSWLGTIDCFSVSEPCALAECPPGLFLFDDTLCFMSEYSSPVAGARKPDAYIVETGEYFWGGTSDPKIRDTLRVIPIEMNIPWGDFS